MNIVTIFLGVSVGATATAATFLSWQTLSILLLGIVAFGFGTAGGVLLGKADVHASPADKVNPLIGSAGVSAVPMAARVSQVVAPEGQSRQLPADARHGPQRGRRHRLRRGGRCAAWPCSAADGHPADCLKYSQGKEMAKKMAKNPLKIMDTILRDAHQSQAATRMTH